MELDLASTNIGSSNTIGDEIEIFYCKICSKPFTNKLSRNRHQLYCLKKQRPGQLVLRKSCVACRKAKIKCNSAPCCSRCEQKKLICVYEETAKSSSLAQKGLERCPASQITHVANEKFDDVGQHTRQDMSQGYIFDSHQRVHEELANTSYDSSAFITWDSDSDLLPYTASIDSGYNEKSSQGSLSPSGQCSDFNDTFLDVNFDFSFLQENFGLSSDSYNLGGCMFESPYLTLRYIDQLHGTVSRASSIVHLQSPFTPTFRGGLSALGQTFLLENIKTYPKLLLETSNTLPFIHHLIVHPTDADKSTQAASSEHLAVCRSIMQMYEAKTKQTSDFLWRAIGGEMKHMTQKFPEADEWSTLSMLQVITIYIINRIFDPNSFTIEFDNKLIGTMTSIAIKSEQSGFLCDAEVKGYRPCWHEWILMESKRRTVTLLFIIHLLFDISPGQRMKALSGLSALPLPAEKSLWKACTEMEWTELYDQISDKRERRRYLSYADLVSLKKVREGSNNARMNDLNHWLVNVDEFGILVMMAATTFE